MITSFWRIYRVKKILLPVIVMGTVFFSGISLATVAQADEYDTKIEQQDKKINDLKAKEEEAENSLAKVEAEIFKTTTSIDELTAKKNILTEEVKKMYDEISDLNIRIQKREDQMKKQARDVQISGSTGYLEVLVNSESLPDALNRIQGINKLVSANNDLLTQQTNDKKEVEEKSKQTEIQVADLEKATTSLNEKKATLSTLKIQQEVAKNELEIQRSTEEGKKSEYVSQKETAEKKLMEEQARQKAEMERIKKETEEMAKNALLFNHTTNVVETDGRTSKETVPSTGGSKGNETSIGGNGQVSGAKKTAANAALADVGNTYSTGWGAPGECLVSVRRWLNAGGISFAVGGPHSGYTASGAVEVPWSSVQVGDVVQYENALSPDAWLTGVHTVLVVGVNNGSVQIVEANNPGGSGHVSTTTGWVPSPYAANFRAVVWRFPG